MTTITIHNVETGKIIAREMNAKEATQWEMDQADAAAHKQDREEAASAKAALLAKLGITEEEAQLLLS